MKVSVDFHISQKKKSPYVKGRVGGREPNKVLIVTPVLAYAGGFHGAWDVYADD